MGELMVKVAGATVPGAIHLRTGRPNQDAVAWLPGSGEGQRIVMAVSDGHGSGSSPRSHIGAQLAVDVATRVLWAMPQPTSASLPEAVVSILSAWHQEIDDHLGRSPLTDAELVSADRRGEEAHRDLLRRTPRLAYGATLLFAEVSATHIALGQVGDGDALVVSYDGRVCRPLPQDPRLVAHSTTSLCDKDALASTRTAVVPVDGVRLVLLATDGYSNSFTDDAAFLKVGADLVASTDSEGIASVRQSLPRWLAETTAHGAGDDISVAFAVVDGPRPGGPAAQPRSVGAVDRPPRAATAPSQDLVPSIRTHREARSRPIRVPLLIALIMAIALLMIGVLRGMEWARSRTGPPVAPSPTPTLPTVPTPAPSQTDQPHLGPGRSPSPVPEPASTALLNAGVAGVSVQDQQWFHLIWPMSQNAVVTGPIAGSM